MNELRLCLLDEPGHASRRRFFSVSRSSSCSRSAMPFPFDPARCGGRLLLALLEDVELAIERGLAVLDPFLFALTSSRRRRGFDSQSSRRLDQLLAGNQRAGAIPTHARPLRRCVVSLLGGGLREEPPLTFSVAAGAPAKEKRCGGENDQYADRSTQCCRVCRSMLHLDFRAEEMRVTTASWASPCRDIPSRHRRRERAGTV